jgi:hypothetical protein
MTIFKGGSTMQQFNSLREKIAFEKNERESRYQKFTDLVEKARDAGLIAGRDCRPIPMYVVDQGVPIDRIDDGACGFAWVTVKPANSSFAIWAKKNKLMRSAYGGGVQYWVSEFGQSVDRKAAFAGAFAKVLREAGINAVAGDRLD